MKPWLAVILAAAILALGVGGGVYLLELRQGVSRYDSLIDGARAIDKFSTELARLKAQKVPVAKGFSTLEAQAFSSALPIFYRTEHPKWATPAALGIFIFSAGVAGGLLLGGFGFGVSRRRA